MNSSLRLNVIFLALFLPLFLDGFYNPIIAGTPGLYWAIEFTTWILIPSISMYAFWRTGGKFTDIGFCLPPSAMGWFELLLSLTISTVAFLGIYSGAKLLGRSWFPQNYLLINFNYGSLIPHTGIAKTIVWLYFSLSAGIVEELYFRGILKSLFRSSNVLFVLISTLLFSAIHWEGGIHNLIATGAAGLFMCIYYIIYRNIYVLMLAHGFADLILFR